MHRRRPLASFVLVAVVACQALLGGAATAWAEDDEGAGGVDGYSYTSPTFGYALTWPAAWEVEGESSADGDDALCLATGGGSLAIVGTRDYGGDAEACVAAFAADAAGTEGISNLAPMDGGPSRPIAGGDGVVFVGDDRNYLYALDAETGQELWHFKTGQMAASTVVDGMVYVAGDDQYLHAIDVATGLEKWHVAVIGLYYSAPAVVDGTLYIGSPGGHFYAVDAASGEQRWGLGLDQRVTSAPAVVDGVVFSGGFDDHLHAVDGASGTELWRFQTGGWIESSPAIIDGVI